MLFLVNELCLDSNILFLQGRCRFDGIQNEIILFPSPGHDRVALFYESNRASRQSPSPLQHIHPFLMTVSIAELAVPYAVLALYDSEKPITADAIIALLEAANIEVERVWAEVFAKAFQDPSKVAKLVEAVGAGAASAPVAQAAAASGAPAAAAAAPKEEKKEAKAAAKEESDEEMGFGLFD